MIPTVFASGGSGGVPVQSATPSKGTITTGSNCGGAFLAYSTNDEIAQVSTTSSSFVDVPGTSVTFTEQSFPRVPASTCVAVTFSAYAFAQGSGSLMEVQAVLDGSTIGLPGFVQFTGSDNTWASAHAYTFVFPNVSLGTHTVKIQFSSFLGTQVFIHRPSVVVHYM
jgi:hypothetical protein